MTTITRLLTATEIKNLETSAAELAERAAKLGVPAPTYRLTGVEGTRPATTASGVPIPGITLKVYEVEYETHPIRYNGWKFLALVDHEVGIVVAGPDAPEGIVAEYTGTEPTCDVCGHNRYRNHTVVVEHEDGRRLRAGGECVKNYIGNLSLSPWAKFASESEDFGLSGKSATVVPTEFVVAVASEVIKAEKGYVTAGSDFAAPTKGVVGSVLFPPTNERREDREFRLGVLEGARANLDYARAAIEWAKALPGDSDFELNLRAVVEHDEFDATARGFGLLVFVAEGYRRHLDKSALVKAEAAVTVDRKPVPWTSDRIDIEGVVTLVKYNEDTRFPGYKIRVLTDDGWAVWGNRPTALAGGLNTDPVKVGDRVAFVAGVTRSDRDEFFGFFSRPSKVRFVERVAA